MKDDSVYLHHILDEILFLKRISHDRTREDLVNDDYFAHAVRSAIEKSAVEMGLGRGDSEYKFAWTNHVRVENEILFGHNWKGTLWIALGNLERSIKTTAGEFLTGTARKHKRRYRSAPAAKAED